MNHQKLVYFKNYLKSDLPDVLPSGCHHLFANFCKEVFVEELPELGNIEVFFLKETKEGLAMGKTAENT